MLNGDEPAETLSKTDAARRLGISQRTLHRLVRDGELDAVPDGPKGGLQPTRASVERRLEHLDDTKPPANSPPAPVHEGPAPPPPPTELDGVSDGPARSVERDVPATRKPRRKTHSARVLTGGGRRAGSVVMRLLRSLVHRRVCTARALIAAVVVAGLLLIGATRELPGEDRQTQRISVLLISSKSDHHHPRRIRLHCQISSQALLRVQLGKRPRCHTARAKRRAR
jgi:excisionase family DNA binding protein